MSTCCSRIARRQAATPASRMSRPSTSRMFAQLRPGTEVCFERITHAEAESLLLASEKDYRMLKTAIALKFR
ncbi:putative KipI antagonist [Paenibacillus agaridevorans]|uniref:Putative KipI antagonist n=1 Tax=Paenibacillus agaridevorans TaxID=171404 RepID=A0A2R5EVK7_9BACL|nr:putative KipI antagonist [Paenibacillus agaridevorans]